ncbi:MAG: glycoside hydrolase family 88 protein [Bacteroidales bacterium]|jgi:predicted alpha-1,6-mannanase (GH76 family)|nr:glycoside hydrolase family 88 protein [Bacteroidales bacterium]
MKKYCFLIGAAMLFAACKKDHPAEIEGGETAINWASAADSSSKALISLFWNAGGKYFNYDSDGKPDFHYWPQAHALDVLIDAFLRTDDRTYQSYFAQWFEGVRIKNGNTFRNDYYDDMEWNALAILRAYQATGDTRYKDAALQIWEYIKTGWNSNAGGGICWARGHENSKNACSNGPACILAARLYREFGDADNKDWALRIYNWEKSTLFNSNNGMVYDNINSETGEIKSSWVFTYNQGTFIGSAVELYQILGEKSYLNDAVLAADYTTSSLVDNSVLKSEGTGDGGLFKGIFVRYFVELIQQDRLDAAAKKRYVQFIRYNAETLWLQGAGKTPVLFGPSWRTKPSASTGLTEQLSGSMLIEAAALLKSKDLW